MNKGSDVAFTKHFIFPSWFFLPPSYSMSFPLCAHCIPALPVLAEERRLAQKENWTLFCHLLTIHLP